MPRITDHELINRLIVGTDEGRIEWQPTGSPIEFTASFGGKWTLLFNQEYVPNLGLTSVLYFKDSAGETLLRITPLHDERIPELYEMARRRALKIDDALADLLKEIEGPPRRPS